jgi:hypothetical protein
MKFKFVQSFGEPQPQTYLDSANCSAIWTASNAENGYCESFNGKMRDECLNGENFYSLKEAQIVIEQWRVEVQCLRPDTSASRFTS